MCTPSRIFNNVPNYRRTSRVGHAIGPGGTLENSSSFYPVGVDNRPNNQWDEKHLYGKPDEGFIEMIMTDNSCLR